jgi:hypothetical protein
MRFVVLVCCIFSLYFTNPAYSQTGDTVRLKGSVSDSYTNRPLAGVSIINSGSSVTIPSDTKGQFETTVKKADELFLFYPGYRTTKFSVKDSVLKEEYILKLSLEPLTASLSQPVIIKAPKTLEEIEEDRKKLGITPKELERPEMSFTSPISAIYEMLSGHAQEREKLKGQMAEDDRRKIFKQLLDFYNENELIDLPESHYEAFINYCNLPMDFLKYSSDYEITKTIITLYKQYGLDSGIIK